MCDYFVLCGNVPTMRVPHPVLGDVATCDRCADRVDVPAADRLPLLSETGDAYLPAGHEGPTAPCGDCGNVAPAYDVPCPTHGCHPMCEPCRIGAAEVHGVALQRYDHAARPDDDPTPGDRCKDCRHDVTWLGPGMADWVHVA